MSRCDCCGRKDECGCYRPLDGSDDAPDHWHPTGCRDGKGVCQRCADEAKAELGAQAIEILRTMRVAAVLGGLLPRPRLLPDDLQESPAWIEGYESERRREEEATAPWGATLRDADALIAKWDLDAARRQATGAETGMGDEKGRGAASPATGGTS